MGISEKVSELRQDAEVLRRYGQDSIADVLSALAVELEMNTMPHAPEVGLVEAMHQSGYSAAHLRRLVKEGKLQNIGTSKKPRFLTTALPRKPGYIPENKELASGLEARHISKHKQVARAVVQRRTNDGAD